MKGLTQGIYIRKRLALGKILCDVCAYVLRACLNAYTERSKKLSIWRTAKSITSGNNKSDASTGMFTHTHTHTETNTHTHHTLNQTHKYVLIYLRWYKYIYKVNVPQHKFVIGDKYLRLN